jgi:hypothetical protein
MFQQLLDSPTRACNDNGSFFRRRGHRVVFPSGILRIANDTAGPICLSYVAQGVFIISGQDPTPVRVHRRRARAA